MLLFLEADFDTLRKINFNDKLMNSLEASSAIPHKITCGVRLQAAAHLVLSKK